MRMIHHHHLISFSLSSHRARPPPSPTHYQSPLLLTQLPLSHSVDFQTNQQNTNFTPPPPTNPNQPHQPTPTAPHPSSSKVRLPLPMNQQPPAPGGPNHGQQPPNTPQTLSGLESTLIKLIDLCHNNTTLLEN